jgi:hypothetical protein
LHKRVRVRLRLGTEQLRQAGNAGSDAPGFVAREQTGSRALKAFQRWIATNGTSSIAITQQPSGPPN